MPVFDRFLSLILLTLLLTGLSGCASLPQNEPTPTGTRLVHQIKRFLGTPYRYGGNTPNGFDCSGLVQFAYARVGIAIPRTTHAQLVKSRPVNLSDMRPGDLLFFRLRGHRVSHVGMYVGHRLMIHAPSNHKAVTYAHLGKGYWHDHLVAVGRYY